MGEHKSEHKCWHYEPLLNERYKVNDPCPMCNHWGGKKCKDEALLLAEWDRKHGSAEWEMRQNRGVRID